MPIDIRRSLKKYVPHVLQARSDNLNEADTLQRLIKIFEDVLGYDPMADISHEARMKNKFVDLVLKVDGAIRVLVEAKAANEPLRERHIEQAQQYASRNNFPWVLLTNGIAWHLYHLTFEEGIEYKRAFAVDLSVPEQFDAGASYLGYLHKQSIKKNELEEFWQQTTALNPASIGRAIFNADILAVIRRELRRDTGVLIDPEDLAAAIHDMLAPAAREIIGPVKIRRKRSSGVKKEAATPTAQAAATASEPIAVDVPAASTNTPSGTSDAN